MRMRSVSCVNGVHLSSTTWRSIRISNIFLLHRNNAVSNAMYEEKRNEEWRNFEFLANDDNRIISLYCIVLCSVVLSFYYCYYFHPFKFDSNIRQIHTRLPEKSRTIFVFTFICVQNVERKTNYTIRSVYLSHSFHYEIYLSRWDEKTFQTRTKIYCLQTMATYGK